MKRHSWNRTVVIGVAAIVAVGFLAIWAAPASAVDAEAGRAIYNKRCAMCHGNGGAGDGPMGKLLKPAPPSLADSGRMAGRSDGALTKIIAEGENRMPGYSGQLSAEQIQDVLAYIRTLAAR